MKLFCCAFILWVSILLPGCSPGGKDTSPKSDQAAVEDLVKAFGTKLKMVSLLAPPDIVGKSMRDNYSPYVSPPLLAQWMRDPLHAPGRLTSSPWPDSIRIQGTRKLSRDAYEVWGEIVEMTSAGKPGGNAAAGQPITLTIRRFGHRWLIDAVTLGKYETAAAVVYTNPRYGFQFTLPKSWKGYSMVDSTWEGRAVAGPKAGRVVETGPLLSIRHPLWTARKPRQDIPIMVFTLDQWNKVEREEISLGAAPIGPSELGRNNMYVFGLPARYNYAFPAGFEEVEKILAGHPLKTFPVSR